MIHCSFLFIYYTNKKHKILSIIILMPSISYLPFDVLNIILQYDGRIKYSHKTHKYINIISKNDYRYNMLESRIHNKVEFIQFINFNNFGLKYYIDINYKDNEYGLIFSKKLLE